MYDEHYGLSGRPFQLTPDPRFWYETATHRKAMAYLGYGLAQGEGFIVITGDIGAGKTTLMGHLTDGLDPAALSVIKIVSTAIEADDLLRIVATGLGIDPAGLAKAQMLTVIERGLHAVARTGRRTLLVVDEAQALPVSALEELRMLSNFQAGGHALLQIVLLGQPEFRDRLHGSDRLEQLRQRVIAIHHLEPMEEHEVADYIAHRLSIVGWQGNPDFAVDAFAALYQGSGGVPRRLNLLAGRVMLHAAVEDLDLIDARTVRAVLRDLTADLPMIALDPREPVAPLPIAPETATVAEAAPIVLADEPDEADAVPLRAVNDTTAPAAVNGAGARRFVPRTERWLQAAATAPVEPTHVSESPPEPAPSAEPAVEPMADAALMERRIAALEARVDEQDAALRRVLTLLVDWVETDRGDPSTIADHDDYAPVRGGSAWGGAA